MTKSTNEAENTFGWNFTRCRTSVSKNHKSAITDQLNGGNRAHQPSLWTQVIPIQIIINLFLSPMGQRLQQYFSI